MNISILSSTGTIANILYVTALLALTLGSIVAFKIGITKTANEVQERVINALNVEINTLKARIDDLERENSATREAMMILQRENWKLQQTLGIIKAALKKRGWSFTIDGDVVRVKDEHGHQQHMGRITTASPANNTCEDQ
jgi:FtsZ-binding cell division protein ZapB